MLGAGFGRPEGPEIARGAPPPREGRLCTALLTDAQLDVPPYIFNGLSDATMNESALLGPKAQDYRPPRRGLDKV